MTDLGIFNILKKDAEDDSSVLKKTNKADYGIFNSLLDDTEEDTTDSYLNDNPNNNILLPETITPETLKNDKLVRQAAVRFARDKHGITDISEDDAIDNFIEHFRSFNVNELTAAGDWNYISGVSADASKINNFTEQNKQKLSDYALLYRKFSSLPNWHGGVGSTLGDYAKGIALAPSTLVGLIPMFGWGVKGGALATTQAAKAAVGQAVKKATKDSLAKKLGKNFLPTNIVNTIAANPIKTAMAIEGTAGGLLDVSRQNVEMELGFRDEYSPTDTAIGVGAGMAAPAFLGYVGAKMAASKAIGSLGQGRVVDDNLLSNIDKNILKKNAAANKKAENLLKNTEQNVLSSKITDTLPALDPEKVAKGQAKFGEIEEVENITPDFVLNIDPTRTKRVLAAVTEIISSDSKLRNKFLRNSFDKTTGTWKIRAIEAVSLVLKEPKVGKKSREAFVEDIFSKYNITGDDFANLFVAQFSQAGRQLKQASQFKKFMNTLSDDVTDLLGMDLETKSIIKNLKDAAGKENIREFTKAVGEASEFGYFRGLARSADDLRLAAMTSQTGTTVRNTVSGYVRLGADTLVNTFDRAIGTAARGLGKKDVVGFGFDKPNDDIFSLIMGLANGKETRAIDNLFKANFHKQASSLYRELRDIDLATGSKSKKLSKARAIGKQLNALNTVSDNFFKRIAFVGSLKRQLNEGYTRALNEFESTIIPLKNNTPKRKFEATIKKSNYTKSVKDALLNLDFKNKYNESIKTFKTALRKEYDIIDMIKTDRFGKYLGGKQGGKVIQQATEDALYTTYQKTPDSPFARGLLKLAHNAPFLTSSLVPFPRFIMNALRFTYEYSPAYLLMDVFGKGAISQTRAAGTKNFQEIGKSLTGMAGFAGAYAFRQSEFAGENWWEGRLPNGKSFDLRPFFPAAPYLFLADLAVRSKREDPLRGDYLSLTRESLQALSGTQFRAGLNIDLFDDGVNDIFGSTDKDFDKMEAVGKLSARVIGNIMNTYTIPITPVKDIYDTWIASDDARIVRETKSSDMLSLFVNRSLSRLPANYRIEEILSEALGTRASDEYETPLKGERIRRYQTFTRQFAGILQSQEKNYVEKELARMKLRKSFINQNTGVPEADTLINALLGEWTSTYLSPLLEQSKEYKEADNDLKKLLIKTEVAKWKQDIKDIVFNEQKLLNENNVEVSVEKYGFNPLKKAKVLKEYSGNKKQFLNAAIEAYERQFPSSKRGTFSKFRNTDSYDWDIIRAFAESFENGFVPLTPSKSYPSVD